MIKFIKWFIFHKEKPVSGEYFSLCEKFLELEEKYNTVIQDVKRLEEENIETTNVLYELLNSLDALDARIDILSAEHWIDKRPEQD
jgi:hypothetical protein